MTHAAITAHVLATYAGVYHATNEGDAFFIYDPARSLPRQKQWPFATIVTKDNDFDRASNLNRPDVFRLNIGVGRETFARLFGPPPEFDATDPWKIRSDIDFAALDTLMPHPMYGRMYWVSVLNPSDATFDQQIRPLLEEAYALVVRRYPPPDPQR